MNPTTIIQAADWLSTPVEFVFWIIVVFFILLLVKYVWDYFD